MHCCAACALISRTCWLLSTRSARRQGGRTPLHFAAQAGHLDVCTLLITHGGTKSAVSNNGMTPFDLASENGHVAVAQIVDASSTVVVAAPNPLLMLVRQLFGSCQPRGAGR